MKPGDFADNLARFWAKVDKTGDCLIWIGETNRLGYGRFVLWHDGGRTRILAHRLSLKLHGIPLGDDQVVMHACDNPPCVNPEHLSAGTQGDNVRDAVTKGRADLSGLELSRNRLIAKERRKAAADAA